MYLLALRVHVKSVGGSGFCIVLMKLPFNKNLSDAPVLPISRGARRVASSICQSGKKKQATVEFQLLVTLKRLGFSGNGASLRIVARMFCVGHSIAVDYTNRCIRVLRDVRPTAIV